MTGSLAPLGESARPRDDGLTLLTAVAGGDAGALAALYDRHAGIVYSICTLVLGNSADAKEAVADTFVQIWRTAGRFDPARGSVATWIVTIARSRALDLLRGRARRNAHVDTAVDPAQPAAVANDSAVRVLPDTEQVDAHRLAVWALEQLPASQREAIELAYLEGLTHIEIATRLETPVGTVKTRIRDGMKKLRGALASSEKGVSA